MGKVKNYMMDIQENVWNIDGLETKIGECEHIEEVNTFVVETLGLKTHFDIDIAKDAILEMWNDFWGYY
tara:strand:- start:1968 stop:2174 length:207 start_codon:yes stop_codon:yes gene_type:complete